MKICFPYGKIKYLNKELNYKNTQTKTTIIRNESRTHFNWRPKAYYVAYGFFPLLFRYQSL